MEPNNCHDSHIVEVQRDPVLEKRRFGGGNKFCGEVHCEFENAGTSSADAAERSASMRKLLIAVVLCVIFMTVEVIGGIKANSLSILTDAAHLLSDVAAFAISLFSLWASGWEATPRQSYGFLRIEILGALVSIQLIWLLAGILVYEAVVRIIHETGEVNGFLMFVVSAFGLVVNIIMALVLGHDHVHGHGHGHGHGHSYGHDHDNGHGHGSEHLERSHSHTHSHGVIVTASPRHQHTEAEHNHAHEDNHAEPLLENSHVHNEHNQKEGSGKKKKKRNINVQGAYLHVLGDSIQSVGVMIGGGIIWYKPEWKIVDLICTLVFSIVVLWTTIKMLRDILEVLMESTPREIDATKLQTGLLEMEEVVAVHELHIWAITVGKILLACHVKVTPEADADLVLDKVVEYIRKEYNISHVTIQIER